MKKIITIIFITIGLLKADENVLKVVLDLTTADVSKFERTVLRGVSKNKAYYEGQFKELEVVVIIHGESYKFFLKDLLSTKYKNDKELLKVKNDFATRIRSMSKTYDVKFLVCKAGIDSRGIKKEDMYDVVELIPNAMIGLIDTQNDGFAYVPVR